MSEIPLSWVTRPFGELNKFYGANVNPASHPTERFELYSIPAFPAGKPELPLGSEVGSTKQMVEHNDVLISKINPRINRVWQVGPSVGIRQIASSEWIGFRTRQMDARFFRYYFISPVFRDMLCSDVTGVGGSLTRAQPKRVASFPVPVAPAGEQKRIADKLDTVLTRVDAVNDCLTHVAPILKRFRQSVLAAATSGRLTEDWRSHNAAPTERIAKDHSASDLPDSWMWKPLGEVSTCSDNKRVPVKASDRASRKGPYPYYGAFGVIDSIDDYLLDGEYLLLAEDGKNLESRDRPIALVARGKFWVNNHAHVLQGYGGMTIKYLLNWLNCERCDISDLLTGIDQIKLTRSAMDKIPVPVPPPNEQAEIIRRVETLFAFADRLEARLQTAQTATERLTPSLLAKAFRGELVPQDPNDEPAGQLLRRLVQEAPSAGTKRGRRSVA